MQHHWEEPKNNRGKGKPRRNEKIIIIIFRRNYTNHN